MGVGDDLAHELVGGKLALLHGFELAFPFASEFGGLEVGVGDEGDEVAAGIGSDEVFLALALDVFASEQGLDDLGAGGGRRTLFFSPV